MMIPHPAPSEIGKTLRSHLQPLAGTLAILLASSPAAAPQTITAPQQLAFAGLRSVASTGQFNAAKVDAAGNLYLLLDQKDGVRLLKTDPSATSILAQAALGTHGDIGLSMALDPAGNIYVTGTSTSGSLSGTPGAAFPQVADTSTNSFIAKYDSNLNNLFVTFCGGGRMAAASIAATADAILLTGSVFAATLPVTPNAIQQSPAPGSTQNGFAERFSSDGSTLLYATYLTGAEGDTSPASIAVDSTGQAYVTGYTTAPGFPTVAALVPRIPLPANSDAPASGFLTKLTAAGDGIAFSTFIPGTGITSIAFDVATQNLLLSGNVDLGRFPLFTVQTPLVASPYQVLLRMPLDGSSVLASTVLAPGSQSTVSPAPNGAAWVTGTLSSPLLPLTPLSNVGSAFAVRVTAQSAIDQTLRLGGLPTANAANASAPLNLSAIAVNPAGQPLLAGSFTPTASSSLLLTERYDLPLTNAPTSVLPSTVSNVPPPSGSCNGSLCSGSAAYLARLNPDVAAPALAISADASPEVTLRNLGSAEATGLNLTARGFAFNTSCGSTLAAGAECSILLFGSGPGSVMVSAANATAQTATLPALPSAPSPSTIVFSPKELDFGIQTATSAPILRTFTVFNLGQQQETFNSAIGTTVIAITSPFTEASSDCTPADAPGHKILAAGATCHITIALALNATVPDGPIKTQWTVGPDNSRGILLTAYAQAAALSVSAGEIGFGTQFAGGLHSPRFLYLSNNSDGAIPHNLIALPANSPFTAIDRCSATLLPHSVCQLQMDYRATSVTADDALTLFLDNNLSVRVTGQTIPQPGISGSFTNPNLRVSPSTIRFPNAVPVTGTSSSTQTVTVSNTGATPLPLSFSLSGDFAQVGNCGTSLAPMASCSVVLTFAPSAPGLREGLLAVTAGAGTDPVYVDLSGTGTAILPMNNGTLDFGDIPVTEPTVQWFKVLQPFQSFSAATTGAFKVIFVLDIGFGHGNPPQTSFQTNASGACLDCFIGIQFRPSLTGFQAGTLTLSSTSSTAPYVITLTGTGLPLFGPILSPITQDFGPIAVGSTSQTFLFTLTNLVPPPALGPITVTAPATTGDFAISSAPSGGAACGGPLALSASCYIEVTFSPTASGPRTGALTLQTTAGTVTAALSGFGSPATGLSLNPAAIAFQNVPGTSATQQAVTLTNTSSNPLQIGTPVTTNPTFAPASACAALAPGASCIVTITYTPATALSGGILQIPVSANIGGSSIPATYTVPLTGAFTSEESGLQIIPSAVDFGPTLTGTVGFTRTFTINNLTSKAAALSLAMPRQFVLTRPNPCPTLPANGSCNFDVTFLPLTGGDATGTVFATATPTDNSATFQGLAYFMGYGSSQGTSSLTFSGALSPGTGILDFGQVTSGQTASQTLTLTNTSSAQGPLPAQDVTIRRITSDPPFLSTTTCGARLAPGQNCTVTLTYSPFNQVLTGTPPTQALADSGALIVESDASSSPDMIDLTGSAAAVTVASPASSAALPTFTLSESALTFTPVSVGNASAAQTVTLTNNGTATLHILNLQSTADFTASGDCPAALLAGSACTLSLAFTPRTSGIRSSSLEIASDATTSLEFISLFGVASPSSILLSAQTLDFGSVQVGASAILPLQITNNGLVPVAFSGITASGDYAATGSCPAPPATLSPATSCTIQTTFTPTTPGRRTGTLSIASSASTLPLTVSLTGVAVQSHLQITPSTLDFGSIAAGSSANLTLALSNTGSAPILGLTLSITGDYAVTGPCALTALAPGQSCSVTVTFTPSSTGSRPGALTVTGSGTPSTIVPLTGTGILAGDFSLTVNQSSNASATIRSGNPATYTLTVTPTGGFSGNVVLNCTPLSPIPYASCAILPSSIQLADSPQNAVLTINTVLAVQTASTRPATLSPLALCILSPGLLVLWKARRRTRFAPPLLWTILCTALATSLAGCGGGPNPNFRFVTPGTYQYQITASSTSGIQIVHSVTVSLVVTN